MMASWQPFYDYPSGDYDPEVLAPEDVFPATTPLEAARELAEFMAENTGKEWWRRPEQIAQLATLIEEGRHRYFFGYAIGEPAVLAGIEPGHWQHLDGYRDWWGKLAPEGSAVRPNQRELIAADGPTYGPVWDDLFDKPLLRPAQVGRNAKRRARAGKPPLKPQANRKRPGKYGTLNNGLGDFGPRQVGSVPFYGVLPLVERWWRANRPTAFSPNFKHAGDDKIVPTRVDAPWMRTWANGYDLVALNEAALFWAAFCGKLDFLLDLDRVEPDRRFWEWLLRHLGLADLPSDADLVSYETMRLYRIADSTARAARTFWRNSEE